MKSLVESINESLFEKTDVRFVYRVLDLMDEMSGKNKEKNFGIKFDEICGNIVAGIHYHTSTLKGLEDNGYLSKTKDNKYCIKVTTTTHNNTIPCRISVDADIVVGRDNKLSDDDLRKRIKDAVEELKKKTKLY